MLRTAASIVTAPLARSGIIAAWCFIFIGVIRELSASIILFTPNTKVMSVVIFDLKEEGQFGAIAVLGLIMLVLTFATVSIVQAVLSGGLVFLAVLVARMRLSGPLLDRIDLQVYVKPVALEQLHPQRVLELGQLGAERGLGHVAALGRLAERQLLRHRDGVLELAKGERMSRH